jgi:outer membrane protein TolC
MMDRSARFAMLAPYKLISVLLGAICLGYVVSPIGPVEAQRREMRLSLREATAFALQGNLEIQIAGLNPRIREAQITEEKGIFDVEGIGTFMALDERLLETSNTFLERVNDQSGRPVLGHDNSQEQQLSLAVSQLTPYGGTYEIELFGSHLSTTRRTTALAALLQEQIDAGQVDPVTGLPLDPSPRVDFYETGMEFKITQPLLKNFGSTVTKNQILIAQNNFTISQEDFRQQVIATTSRVQRTYWILIFRRQDLEVRKQQLALAERLLKQVRRQVAVGTLAPIEVLQTEADIARTKERIIVAENAVRDAEDRLKRVMNFSLTGELADVELLPTDVPTYIAPTLNQLEQNKQALEHRPELQQAKLVLANQNITLVFNKNQVLPTLDLEASYRFNGLDTKFKDNFDRMQIFGRDRWEIGLAFRYPLKNSQAKSRLQQSRLAIQQQVLRIKNLEEDIIAEVRAAARDVLTNAQRVQATRAASRLAQKQLEAEEKKLKVGLATVFTVLEFQDDLAVERSNEVNALTEYMQAQVRLEAAKGTLLESYNIVLQSNGPRLQ